MKLQYFIICLFLLGSLEGCKHEPQTEATNEKKVLLEQKKQKSVTIAQLVSNLEDSQNDQVIVVAHRGDWRNAPENSLQAIENCIKMGVDMVEIDIRETKDGQLILMHDETIDRTTTGTGKVTDLTWDYLQTLLLRDGIGHETPHPDE